MASYPEAWSGWSPAEQLDFMKATHDSLNKPYHQVKIACDRAKSTLLPTAVYKDGTGTDYFELVFGPIENEQLHRDSLASLEVDFISSFPMGWQGASQLHFPGARLMTVDAALSLQLARVARLDPVKQFFLKTTATHLSLWAFDGQQFCAYNRFKAETAEDALYYCLLFSQELAWTDVHLRVLGTTAAQDTSSELLAKHFKKVVPLEANQAIAFDPQLSQFDSSVIALLSACLCAS